MLLHDRRDPTQKIQSPCITMRTHKSGLSPFLLRQNERQGRAWKCIKNGFPVKYRRQHSSSVTSVDQLFDLEDISIEVLILVICKFVRTRCLP